MEKELIREQQEWKRKKGAWLGSFTVVQIRMMMLAMMVATELKGNGYDKDFNVSW
jgi:hypothetical protein